jgi:hypothetical protein
VQIQDLTSVNAKFDALEAGDKVKPSIEHDKEIDATLRTYLLSTLLWQVCQINELLQGKLWHEAFVRLSTCETTYRSLEGWWPLLGSSLNMPHS